MIAIPEIEKELGALHEKCSRLEAALSLASQDLAELRQQLGVPPLPQQQQVLGAGETHPFAPKRF